MFGSFVPSLFWYHFFPTKKKTTNEIVFMSETANAHRRQFFVFDESSLYVLTRHNQDSRNKNKTKSGEETQKTKPSYKHVITTAQEKKKKKSISKNEKNSQENEGTGNKKK